MSTHAWVRLDNASNIFLAARTDADTKVFRMSAELDHDIEPELLQQALASTYERYRLYHAVLRSGVFWYYLQDSDLRPEVKQEDQPTCAAIYQPDRRTLLFRVRYYRKRIVLELFHALSDGTGALWFVTDLVSAYLRLRQPKESGVQETAELMSPKIGDDAAEPVHELTGDSFANYFRRQRRRKKPDSEAFTDAASPAALTLAGSAAAEAEDVEAQRSRRRSRRVYRVKGTRTPDNRTRAVELTMPAGEVLGLARAEGASLTMYLTALFLESIRRSARGAADTRTLAASVPVNLRQFFASDSPRNFFATIRVEHTYGQGDDSLGAVCRNLEAQFRPKATPEALESKLRRFIRFERMPVLRIIPRPIKDVILGVANRISNRSLSVAVSNLGRVVLPEPAETQVGRMLFHVSAARPQFCAMSHAGLLTVSFTSPFVETDHIREFARILTGAGIDVTVAAARVTGAELGEEE